MQYKILSSELSISKNCYKLLSERIVQLERNVVNNAQYHRRELLEINPDPTSTSDDVLESSVCKALYLTGHEVKPDDLQTCHRLKKKDTVIVKFKFYEAKSAERTSVMNHMFSPNLIFLVSSSLWKAHVMITISYLINVDS